MKNIKTIAFFLVSTAFILSPTALHASPAVVFEDNFDNGNADNWSIVGDPGWEVMEGKYGIFLDPGLSNTIPKDELWDINWKDIIYEVDLLGISGTDKNILLKFENIVNFIELHHTDGKIFLTKVNDKNGQVEVSNLAIIDKILENGIEYHFKFVLDGNQIQVFLDEDLIIDVTETGPSLGNWKVGLRAGTGATRPTNVLFDNVKVSLLSPDFLPVPDLKQTDPLWASLEYDSASLWVKANEASDINRWGCALTNAAMILQYHGYQINPDELNTWMIQNNRYVDGVNGGIVSWEAISTYTKQVNNGILPVLEFKYTKGDQENLDEVITNNLENQNPSVLRLVKNTDKKATHFVVAKGKDAISGEFIINDPASNTNTLLSEALTKYNSSLDAVGVFVPSQTDTSYIVLAVDEDTNIAITDDNGNPIPDSLFITEYPYMNPETNESLSGTPLKTLRIPKPASGNYKISTNSQENDSLQAYLQDINGQSEAIIVDLPDGQNTLILSFDKENAGNSNIKLLNYETFFQLLDEGVENGDMQKGLSRAIRSIMNVAQNMNIKEKHHIELFLLNHTERTINHFTPRLIEPNLSLNLLEVITALKLSLQ